MASLLDRYIARQYLANVLILLVILFSFIVTVDVAWNFDRFWTGAGRLASENGQEPGFTRHLTVFVFAVFDLWWPRLVQLYGFLVGLVLVAAMGFTCSQFVRQREFVAMLASGQSLRRVIRPLVGVAGVFLGLQALSHEFVLPRIAPLLARDQGDAGRRGLGTSRVPLMADGTGRLLYAAVFNADEGVLSDVRIWERDDTGLGRRRITAPVAKWDGSAWVLSSPRILNIVDGVPVPAEAGGEFRFETNLDPTGLKMQRFERFSANLSFAQLTRMRERAELFSREAIDRLDRLRFGRFTILACDLLALLIAIPFFATRVPSGILPQALRCAPVAMAATLGGVFGASMVLPGIPAIVGVALPVIILAPIALALIAVMRT